MKQYGLPYMGSKSAIADAIMSQLPKADIFVDAFAGGCAMTQCALLSGKYAAVIANDINDTPQLFCDAVNGKYRNETRWISREDFHKLKASDPYVRICWSFGNQGENYMYAQEVEPWKKALHYAYILDDFSLMREFGITGDITRASIKRNEAEYKEKYIRWWLSKQEYSAEELDVLIAKAKSSIHQTSEELRAYLCDALKQSGLTQSEVNRRLNTQMASHYFGASQWEFPTQEEYKKMQAFLPALDQEYNAIVGIYELQKRLQSLQRLQRDYRSLTIPANSVVYCDPPYAGTNQYNSAEFDSCAFWQWARKATQIAPVYISEYTAPPDFVALWQQTRVNKMQGGCGTTVIEKLFIHESQANKHISSTPQPEFTFEE